MRNHVYMIALPQIDLDETTSVMNPYTFFAIYYATQKVGTPNMSNIPA